MRAFLLAIAAGALMGGAAQAAEEPTAVAAKAVEPARKVLVVCSEEERDWRLFSRDLGTPDFVTAKQVREGLAWTGAKCITPAEMRKLTTLALADKPAK